MKSKDFSFFYNIIFPTQCIYCGIEIDDRYGVCRSCLKSFVPMEHCFYCGRTDCDGNCIRFVPYDGVLFLYEYNDIAHKVMMDVKFGKNKILLYTVIKDLIIARKNKINSFFENFLIVPNKTIVTYVPMSLKRRLERGFNQAKILADIIANLFGFKLMPLLKKRKNTPRQSGLPRENRIKNLLGSITPNKKYYGLLKDKDYYRDLIIVDDIYTTGTTISLVSKVIRDFFSFDRVFAITIFRA